LLVDDSYLSQVREFLELPIVKYTALTVMSTSFLYRCTNSYRSIKLKFEEKFMLEADGKLEELNNLSEL